MILTARGIFKCSLRSPMLLSCALAFCSISGIYLSSERGPYRCARKCPSIHFLFFWLCYVGFSSCSQVQTYYLVVAPGLLTVVITLVAEHGLRVCGTTGLAAPQHGESSWTRDQTCVPCVGTCILYHWTTREVLAVHS